MRTAPARPAWPPAQAGPAAAGIGLEMPETAPYPSAQADKEGLLQVLAVRFKYGFRPDSIALARLRAFALEDLGHGLRFSDEELKRFIAENGMSFEGKAFFVSEETKEKICLEARAYFDGGARIIFWDEFYAKHEAWLFNESIVSEAMLEAVLRELFHELTFTQTFFGYTDKQIAYAVGDEILRVWGDDKLLTYGRIAERLMYVPIERIKDTLAQGGSFIWNGLETYARISAFDITDEERSVIQKLAQIECDAHGYVSMVDLPLSEVGWRNYWLSGTAVQNAVFRACLAEGYDKKGKIISRKGDAINTLAIMKDYCRDVDQCTLDELLTFENDVTGEAHHGIPLEAAYSVLVRIDRDTFVATKRVDFYVDGIDKAIGHFVVGNYLPIKAVTTFATFPNCGYQWNLFLLESYCRRFSGQFRFAAPGFNSVNAGAIVRKACAMSYVDVMADAVARAGVPLEESVVVRFLFENGYIGKSATAKANGVIEIARAIRDRGL